MTTDTSQPSSAPAGGPDTPVGQPGDGEPSYLAPGYNFRSVTDKISAIVLGRRAGRGWYACFAFSAFLLLILVIAVVYLLALGVGIWGIDIPVAWGFAITNFVWWIGIGHAGTLISAIL